MRLNLPAIAILLLFTIPCKNVAQNASEPKVKPEYRVSLLEDRSVHIEFDSERMMSNILIIIVDELGNTIFLDNQHDFKGIYKCTVDMSTYPKGNYYVRIRNEEEEKQTKLSIR